MGIGACSSFKERKESKERKKLNVVNNQNQSQNQFKKYICMINLGKKYKNYICGFLCDFKYSDQSYLVPTIITYIDLFPKKYKFEHKIKDIFIGYDSKEFKGNLKLIYKSDKYNIVIFKIEINNNNLSYLNVGKYKNNSSYFHLLLNGNVTPFKSLNNYKLNNKSYIFQYNGDSEKALVLNQDNKIIGITIGKSDKGILIDGIIKEKLEEEKCANKSNSNESENKNKNKDSNTNAIYKIKKTNENLRDSNNLNNNGEKPILNKDEIRDNEKLNIGKNKEGSDKKINDISKKESQNEKENKSKDSNSKENNKITIEKNNNNKRFEDKSKKNDNEIFLYFSFKNGKELYLDVKESFSFNQVIEQLNEKYLWLNNINIKGYKFHHKKIDLDKSLKENKLEDNSMIEIIE